MGDNLLNLLSIQINETTINKINNYLISCRKQSQKTNLYKKENFVENCQAKTSNGKECNRKCDTIYNKYCQFHINNPLKYQNVKPKKKILKDIDINLDKINLLDYIKCQNITINNTVYLIDQFGVIFDKKDLIVIGHKIDDKVIWF